jgi:hypothetical protein
MNLANEDEFQLKIPTTPMFNVRVFPSLVLFVME